MTPFLWMMAIGVAVVLWAVFRRGRRRAARSLRMLASRTGGHFRAGRWGAAHVLVLSHGAKQMQVSLRCISPAGAPYQAEIRTTWPDQHVELETAEPTRLVIPGRHASEWGGSDDLREAAKRLESMAPVAEAWAGAKGGWFAAGAILSRADAATVGEWFEATVRLHDLLAAETAAGIAFLGHSCATAKAEACCQVCGIVVEDGEITRCGKCGAPHHKDCWNYNGGCAIYGCKK